MSASEIPGGGVQHAGVSSFHSGYALSCVDGLHSDEGYPHPRPSVRATNLAHLKQEIVTLQDERIQGHQERAELTEQLFARDHALEMTQVQLAHTEA
jgi:hypothetical protein